MAVRFLWKHLLKALKVQTVDIQELDIRYVITVLSIWDDRAKQFMREVAAEETN